MTSTGVDLECLKSYSKEYIRKTTDFNNLEKVEEILGELVKQMMKADSKSKTIIQKFIDLYQEQQKTLRNKMLKGMDTHCRSQTTGQM